MPHQIYGMHIKHAFPFNQIDGIPNLQKNKKKMLKAKRNDNRMRDENLEPKKSDLIAYRRAIEMRTEWINKPKAQAFLRHSNIQFDKIDVGAIFDFPSFQQTLIF